ncbi:MAG: hypothetical protein ACK5QC_02025 [Bacteroidota bacterium]|jgi:hypothetical protein|nr:hypothetical protein [Bacteroidota bacterium]MCA6442057.1 hypothetical protein [Bacteroidota bacterium]
MKNDTIDQIINLSDQIQDRRELHKLVGPLLEKMGNDPEFWTQLFEENLRDYKHLNREWSEFNIPFFYVFENNDFFIKVHIFPSLESKKTNILCSAIHHHNNYLLTSYAAHGSGYETFLFDYNPTTDPTTKSAKLKITKQFYQRDQRIHMVDSWQPHAVINPTSFSATLVFWTPDEKRSTDKLRSNKILKAFKIPIRKLIYLFKLENKYGIAAKETYQWYPNNGKFIGVLEEEFFAPTKAKTGKVVDEYSAQTLFYFMQEKGYRNIRFLENFLKDTNVPDYYKPFAKKLINNESIPETYAKPEINVPNKFILKEEIIEASKNS